MACCGSKPVKDIVREPQVPVLSPHPVSPPAATAAESKRVGKLVPPAAALLAQPPVFEKPANCKKEAEALISYMEAAGASASGLQPGRFVRLLKLIEADMENGLTQREALKAVHLWLTKAPKLKSYCYSQGAIGLVTQAMILHPTRPAVRRYGAKCLDALCGGDIMAHKLTAHACGAFGALVACLREATAADDESSGIEALLASLVCLLQNDAGEFVENLDLRLRPDTTAALREATAAATKKFPLKHKEAWLGKAISAGLAKAQRLPAADDTTQDGAQGYNVKGGVAAAEITSTLRKYNPSYKASDFVQWFPLNAITLGTENDQESSEQAEEAVEGATGVLVDAKQAAIEAKKLGSEGGVDLGDPVMAWNPTDEQTQLKILMCGRTVTIKALNQDQKTAQVGADAP